MNKVDYLNQLRQSLHELPSSVLEEILMEQREHFDAALADGRTEEEIAESLGDPRQIAKAYLAQASIHRAAQAKGLSDSGRQILRSILALLVLTPFNFIFVLGPVLGLAGILIGFISAGLAMFAVGVSFPFWLIFQCMNCGGMVLAGVLGGLGLASFAIAWSLLTLIAAKFSIEILIRYFQFNLEIITGRQKG